MDVTISDLLPPKISCVTDRQPVNYTLVEEQCFNCLSSWSQIKRYGLLLKNTEAALAAVAPGEFTHGEKAKAEERERPVNCKRTYGHLLYSGRIQQMAAPSPTAWWMMGEVYWELLG